MATALLTGGRAPATLELAHALRRSGHRVVMAESLVPPPRPDPAVFVRALAGIVRRERVDLLAEWWRAGQP